MLHAFNKATNKRWYYLMRISIWLLHEQNNISWTNLLQIPIQILHPQTRQRNEPNNEVKSKENINEANHRTQKLTNRRLLKPSTKYQTTITITQHHSTANHPISIHPPHPPINPTHHPPHPPFIQSNLPPASPINQSIPPHPPLNVNQYKVSPTSSIPPSIHLIHQSIQPTSPTI